MTNSVKLKKHTQKPISLYRLSSMGSGRVRQTELSPPEHGAVVGPQDGGVLAAAAGVGRCVGLGLG